MSLEEALVENTAALREVATLLRSNPVHVFGQADAGDQAAAAIAAASKPARTRRTKEQIAADEAAAAAAKQPGTDGTATAGSDANYPLLEGDPVGTRYWVIEKHSTVYKQLPGEPDVSIEGAKIESAAHYLARKEEFAKKVPLRCADGPSHWPYDVDGLIAEARRRSRVG